MVEDKKKRMEEKRARLEERRRAKLAGAGASVAPGEEASQDDVQELGDDWDGEDDDLEGGGVGSSKDAPMYSGAAARNRELQAQGLPNSQGGGDAVRRKRGLPIIGGGLPMQVLAGVRRPRRPRHLRGKSKGPV